LNGAGCRCPIFIPMKWVLLIIITAMANAAAGQSYDSTARPEIYPSKLALFRAGAHTKKDIVFLGNSITFWADWPELLRRRHIRNRGIPGDHTFGVLERLDEVIGGQPRKVFILIGINDIARHFPDSVILRNCERITQRIKQGSPRTAIYWQTILPVNSSFNKLKNHYQPDRIIRINTRIKALAEQEKVHLIDLHPHFTDDQGQLRAGLTFDGVHLTKEGYDIWVQLLRKGRYLQ
jgi:Lysophospholipase L1 and related esterases